MDGVFAVFAAHEDDELAVRRLIGAGCDKSPEYSGQGMSDLRGSDRFSHRTRPCDLPGFAWRVLGGLWGLFFGGLLLTLPGIGIVIVIGYLGATTALAVEDGAVADEFGVLGDLLADMGLPADSTERYEAAVRADGFLVMAHGAKMILDGANAPSLDTHPI